MLCKPGLLVKESKEGAMFIKIPSSSDIDFRFQKGRKSSLNKGGKDLSQSYFATNVNSWPLEAVAEWGLAEWLISAWMRSKIKIQIRSDMSIFFYPISDNIS